MLDYIPWWKSQADFRDKKAVVKLYDENDSFLTSVHIPSVYWPLNGPYEVFTFENTYCIESEPELVSLFNAQEYKIGHCYDNTSRVADAFRKAGYNIKTYCGWTFIEGTIPVHHCWAVLIHENDQKAILDLSCDSFQMRQWFAKKEKENPGWLDTGDIKAKFVDWVTYTRKNLTHAERCYPCGVIPPTHLYIGCECDPTEGILLYNRLIANNPKHLCERKVNAAGYNRTQWMLKQQGLMD